MRTVRAFGGGHPEKIQEAPGTGLQFIYRWPSTSRFLDLGANCKSELLNTKLP